VQTLCDANYVNNASIATPDGGLQFLIYPTGDSGFTLYDDTTVRCQTSSGERTLTLTSISRRLMLQVFGEEPGRVQREGAMLSRLANRTVFDATDAGWYYDGMLRFSFIKFQHLGGSVQIALQH
jgi:hypothetical protein